MRTLKILAAAAVLSTTAVAANAGGANVAPETPEIIPMPAPAPAGSSVNSGYIVLGLLAALVAASASF